MRIFYPGAPDAKPDSPIFRPDQLVAIDRIVQTITKGDKTEGIYASTYHSALLAAGMGSGKTVVTIETILRTRPKRCLIVGVRDAYDQWAEALRDQQHGRGKRPELLRINATATGQANLVRLLSGENGIYYIGLEMLRSLDWKRITKTVKADPALKAIMGDLIPDEEEITTSQHAQTFADMPRLDLLVSDECHKHANAKSKSITTLESIPARAIVALSGTFFGNKFENAHTLTRWLWDEDVVGTRRAWEHRWVSKAPVLDKEGKQVYVFQRGRRMAITKIIGERNPGEFVKTLPCYVFIETPIGPPPKPEIVKVSLTREQRRQYEEMEEESITWIPTILGSGEEALVADMTLVQRIRLRTAALGGMTLVPGKDDDDPDSITFLPGAPSSVLNEAYHVLHRPSWVGKKVLILTHSKPFAIETARRIGTKYSVGLKTGDTSASWRDVKRRFMLPFPETDSIQYLVAVISAVGTATDGLQKNCSKVLWLSEDENNVNNVQGANRIWRSGVDLDDYEAVKLVPRDTIAEGILVKNDGHRVRMMDSITGNTKEKKK